MGFIDSYKSLEKLCSDIYRDNHGVTRYIEDMQNTPDGSFCVENWDNDLQRLKHYRWMRNQIVHEPSCSESSLFEPGAEEWLNEFYQRTLQRTDPLSLYRKTKTAQVASNQKPPVSTEHKVPYTSSGNPRGCFMYMLGALFLISMATLILVMI